MRIIKYVPVDSKRKIHDYQIEMSSSITGEDFKAFKKEYQFLINLALEEMSKDKQPKSFDLDNLPVLNNSLKALMYFMSDCKTVQQWNSKREQAKRLFTFTVISNLDASGFITKVTKKANHN